MCGRFVLHHNIIELQDSIMFTPDVDTINPKFNIAPTTPVSAIVHCPDEHNKKLEIFQWGLVPSWAKDTSWSAKMINARSETINEKPSFRSAFKRRRCLIPASGYYEWKLEKNVRVPYYVHLKSKQPMIFAGLWDIWFDPDGGELHSCTIATVTASPQLAKLHNRMPVILPKTTYEKWLITEEKRAVSLLDYLVPYDSGDIEFYPVSKEVNKADWNDRRAIEPV